MKLRTLFIGACLGLLAGVLPSLAATQAAEPVDLATFHEEAGKLDCKDCHGAVKPRSVTPEQALRTANDQCMSCHGSFANVAAKLRPRLGNPHINPHDSHVVSIECVTCHAAHDKPSQSYCLGCHAFEMPMQIGRRQSTR